MYTLRFRVEFPVRIIHIMSSKPARWREWKKQIMGTLVVTDLPSVPELAAIFSVAWCSLLTKCLGHNPSSTLSFVRKYGPSARQVIRNIESTEPNIGDTCDMENQAKVAVNTLLRYPSTILVSKIRLPSSVTAPLTQF